MGHFRVANPIGGGGLASGTYYIPQVNREDHPLALIKKKFRALADVATYMRHRERHALISCESSQSFDIPENSLDYIFTDPPYAEKIQYGELNFIWEAWAGFGGGWRREETVVKSKAFDPEGLYTPESWEMRMRETFRRCYRALKPGRWMSLCYHDTAEGTWRRVQDTLLDIGFEIHSVTVLDPLQKSSNQTTAEKVVKSDLVLNCRKPMSGELALSGEARDDKSIQERVRTILEDSLAVSPGQTRDKLFDLVARRLLERAQFVEHRFEDILKGVATQAEGDRWYLKQELEKRSQSDLDNEEQAGDALVRFARLRCTGVPAKYAVALALEHPELCRTGVQGRLDDDALETWINQHLFKEDRDLLAKKNKKKLELGGRLAGIEFYDALFFYLTKYMKGKKGNQLPKRNLAEFLQEYLFRFQDGERWLYKPPEGKQEAELRAARRKGFGRQIRAFANGLREGERAYIEKHRPDPRTFVEWLRYCATYGHYEDGLLLYEKAGFTVAQLQSIVLDEAEEETAYDTARQYADTCRRRMAVMHNDEPELDLGDAEDEEEDEE